MDLRSDLQENLGLETYDVGESCYGLPL
jgi:hypothetical protein